MDFHSMNWINRDFVSMNLNDLQFTWSPLTHVGLSIGPYFFSAVQFFHAIGVCLALSDLSLLQTTFLKSWSSLFILSFGGGTLTSFLMAKPNPIFTSTEPLVLYSLILLCFRCFPQMCFTFLSHIPLLPWVLTLFDSISRVQAIHSFLLNNASLFALNASKSTEGIGIGALSTLPWLLRWLPLLNQCILASLSACGGGLVHQTLVSTNVNSIATKMKPYPTTTTTVTTKMNTFASSDFYIGMLISLVSLLWGPLDLDMELRFGSCTLMYFSYLMYKLWMKKTTTTLSSTFFIPFPTTLASYHQEKAMFKSQQDTVNSSFSTSVKEVKKMGKKEKIHPTSFEKEEEEEEVVVELNEQMDQNEEALLNTPRRSLRKRSQKIT